MRDADFDDLFGGGSDPGGSPFTTPGPAEQERRVHGTAVRRNVGVRYTNRRTWYSPGWYAKTPMPGKLLA